MPNFGAPSSARNGYMPAETVPSQTLGPRLAQQVAGVSTLQHLGADRPHNLPADSRSWQVPAGPFGTARAMQLLRGRMGMWTTENDLIPGATRKHSRSLNFLFNPNTITHSFEFNSANVPPPSRNPADKAPNLMSGQSVSWKLYLNRQYEVAYWSPPQPSEIQSGVLGDVKALERVLGTHDGEGIAAVECVVIFGATPGMVPFAYFGWIVQCTVNYLMFNHRMIPTVAEVDITLARRVLSDAAGGTTTQNPGTRSLGQIDANGNITGVAPVTPGAPGTQTTRTVAPDGTIVRSTA